MTKQGLTEDEQVLLIARSMRLRNKDKAAKEQSKQLFCKIICWLLFLAPCLSTGYKSTSSALQSLNTVSATITPIQEPVAPHKAYHAKPIVVTKAKQVKSQPKPLEAPIWQSPYKTKAPVQAARPTVLAKAPVQLPKWTWTNKQKEAKLLDQALQATLRFEGGYTRNDSNGYPAMYGINQQFYKPLPGYPKHVSRLTKAQAVNYYKRKYYNPAWDKKGYSPEYRAFLFDTAVQHGFTVKKIEAQSKGNIRKGVNARLAHTRRWARATGYPHLKGVEKRIKSYNTFKIV